MLTRKDAKVMLKAIGIKIAYNGDYDEWTVNYKNGDKATAYHTNDLQDAVFTGQHMAMHGCNPWRD